MIGTSVEKKLNETIIIPLVREIESKMNFFSFRTILLVILPSGEFN